MMRSLTAGRHTDDIVGAMNVKFDRVKRMWLTTPKFPFSIHQSKIMTTIEELSTLPLAEIERVSISQQEGAC